jgi:ABC-2 type transport system permease protein
VKNALTIARKELRVYFVSPLFYVITALFAALSSYFFSVGLINTSVANMANSFNATLVVMLFGAAILTMRLVSQEKQDGTIELLLTNPVREEEVVAGKFIAAVGMFAAMLAFTLVQVGILLWTGVDKQKFLFLNLGRVDWGPLLTGYVGTLLVGSGFLAIGIFASSLTRNQVVAAMISFAALLMLWLVGFQAANMDPPLGPFLEYLGYNQHLTSFEQGVLKVPDLIYCLTMILVPLYAAVLALGARKWH